MRKGKEKRERVKVSTLTVVNYQKMSKMKKKIRNDSRNYYLETW